MALSDQIINAESGGDANAANPNSSASGAGQFIDPTWVSVIRQHRPDLADGKSDAEIIALKSDPDLNRQMVDAYASDNAGILAKSGLPVTPGTTYLAHFAGPQGAVSVLNADPSAPIGQVLGTNAVKANPFMANMTAGDLKAWADRKMGTMANAPSAGILNRAAPAAPKPTGAPGLLHADSESAEPDLTDVLAKALPPVPPAPAVPLEPIRFAVPKGVDRARLVAALTRRTV